MSASDRRPAKTWKFLMDQIPSLYGLGPVMVIGIALLMISTIPYPASKGGGDGVLRPRSVKLLMGVVLLVLIGLNYPQNTLFLFGLVYIMLGPVGLILKWVGWKGKKPAGESGEEGA